MSSSKIIVDVRRGKRGMNNYKYIVAFDASITLVYILDISVIYLCRVK